MHGIQYINILNKPDNRETRMFDVAVFIANAFFPPIVVCVRVCVREYSHRRTRMCAHVYVCVYVRVYACDLVLSTSPSIEQQLYSLRVRWES